jgi:hypothetical protein
MPLKFVVGILAAALMFMYLGPIVLKLRSPALTIVVLIGIGIMLVDLWQSLKSKND